MWTTPLGVVCDIFSLVFVISAFVSTNLPEATHVLLCCVSLTELGLFPFDLRLTLSFSLCNEITLT